MNVSQITFSPTGGTDKVAEIITKTWGMPVNKIDLSNTETDYCSLNIGKEDIALIAVPSYGGRVPAAAVSRLLQMKGNGAGTILIVVYGNRAYDDTFAELQDAYTNLQNKYKADRFLEGEAGAEAIRKLEELEWAYNECQNILHDKATVADSNKVYEDVSRLIKEDKLVEAQSKLDGIDSRDAEWHYYQSIVYYKKKWFNDSKTQLEICVSMDPKNYKYAEALRKLNADMAELYRYSFY